jgi:hypothetical protein
MEWKNSDPRIDINKRAEIVILRPSLTGKLEAGTGSVETKHVYCVFTSFENHSLVSEDEEWDEAWLWIRMPDKETE